VENAGTDKKVYYRIGEIAESLQVNTSLLRYWEKEFEQFISPLRNKRGVRLYTAAEFETFTRIHTMVKIEGLTLKGAREKLIHDKKAFKEKDDVIRTLSNMRDFLTELKKQIK